MADLFCSQLVYIQPWLVAINANSAYIMAHTCILHQRTSLFAVKAIRCKYIGRCCRMLQGSYIKTYQMAVADSRLHLVQSFLYPPHAVAIKAQLIYGLQHVWVHKIALEANMVIMSYIVGRGSQHRQQKIICRQYTVSIQVYARIY